MAGWSKKCRSPRSERWPASGGEWDGDALYYVFVSFTVAPTVYRYEFAAEQVQVWERIASPIDPERYAVEQVEYPSRDGTEGHDVPRPPAGAADGRQAAHAARTATAGSTCP